MHNKQVGARNTDIGCRFFCRIDYQVTTPGIAATAKSGHVYKEQRFSDHAPLIIDYGFTV
jgi:exonuclease III